MDFPCFSNEKSSAQVNFFPHLVKSYVDTATDIDRIIDIKSI